MSKDRAKFGYLYYNDMLQKISDGIIDLHDVVFTKDTKETYIVSTDGVPVALKSRVYVYNSMTEAIRELNTNTDTYVGQIVSILEGDTYRGYVVNEKKTENGTIYTVTSLTNISSIDYDTLGNKPIINLTGTLNTPIILSQLSNGTYSVTGQYQITETDETIYISTSYIIVIIEKDEDKIFIKKISSAKIVDYIVSNNNLEKKVYITDKFLEENGYATTSYVDNKIAVLDFITKEDLSEYVDTLVNEIFNNVLDSKIDEKIDEKIQSVSDEYVVSLFSL